MTNRTKVRKVLSRLAKTIAKELAGIKDFEETVEIVVGAEEHFPRRAEVLVEISQFSYIDSEKVNKVSVRARAKHTHGNCAYD